MDQALKQRLIGASILIALAVIFVPMLLDEPVQEEGPTTLDIPPRPQPPVHTRRIPAQPGEGGDTVAAGDSRTAPRPADDPRRALDANTGVALRQPENAPAGSIDNAAAVRARRQPPVAGADNERTVAGGSEAGTRPPPEVDAVDTPDESAAVNDSAAAGDNAVNDATQVARAAPAEDNNGTTTTIINNSPPVATNPAASLITPTEPATSGLIPDDQWALQVASFGATENASRLARQLREMGYNPNLDTVYRGGTALHRVRVGPFANRQAATAAGTRINAEIPDLRPRAVAPRTGDTPDDEGAPPPPTAAAATTRPASPDDGLDRFAVQLGSFAGADNADRLQTRAREAGYPAFVERVDGSQGTRYLVKVGPLLSRSDAAATRERLERELGIKGILVDYL